MGGQGQSGGRAAGRPVLEARRVRKAFGKTQALDGVDFVLRRGEVHALLGENGAGKSTLVRILSGVTEPDEGTIAVDGEAGVISSPLDAGERGISVVHQELSLMPNLSVAQNLFLREPPVGRAPWSRAVRRVDRRELRRRAREGLALVRLDVDPDTELGRLSPAQRQLVEIARALLDSARVILLDEPTSSLPPDDRRELFSRVRDVRASGVAVVFITHLLEEALEISDRVTVLRDGRNTGVRETEATSVTDLVEMMTGRPAGTVFPDRPARERGAPALEVRGLSSAQSVRDVTFEARRGEILGLAGLIGSGRSECLETIFGGRQREGGEVLVEGQPLDAASPRDAIEAGIALVPEERQTQGLFPQHSVLLNIGIVVAISRKRRASVTKLGGFVLDRRRLAAVAERSVADLDIKLSSTEASISSLSGGNQQKAILARWLALEPRVVLADEPTRGVSIGSKIEIYKLIRALAAQGTSVVLVSSEFEELVSLCDRVVILAGGRSVGEVATHDLSADDLLNHVLSAVA